MNISMNERTNLWLLKQGGIVTIDPFVFPGLIKSRRILVDHDISYVEPADKSQYLRLESGGIVIYINNSLRIKQKIELSIGGRTPFEQLYVKGLKRLFTENVW